MPKYLDQTGLATLKSKLDTTYAKKNDVYDKTAADGLLSAKANSADVYTKAQVDSAIAGAGGLPTITIAVSQVVSQDPVQVQLTNEQYQIMANNKQVILDGTALGMPSLVANYNFLIDDYLKFIFPSVDSDSYVRFKGITINVSTKIATLEAVPISAGYADRAFSSDRTESIIFWGTAPQGENASYMTQLRVAVLDSDPVTKYNGWIYIIKGSN